MSLSDSILFLTGIPGIGKTSVIKKVAASLADHKIAGFYTEEIRDHNVRQGFALVTFNGDRIVMAHVDSNSAFRVSKYGVDIAAIDRAVRIIMAENTSADLFLIDEIGKMECYSELFVEKVSTVLDSGKPVVATIALKGGGFISAVKNRPGTELWKITKQNRDGMATMVLEWLKRKERGIRR
jgi:nucleoside-triphosphatase